jgi:hypothetical protein
VGAHVLGAAAVLAWAVIPDWADDVIKAMGGLGLLGVILTAILQRRTGRETSAAARLAADAQQQAASAQARNADLIAITARLETELKVLDAGQKMWQAMFDSASERIDVQAGELVAVRADLLAARAEHQRCREEVVAMHTEVRALRARVERRQAPRD